MVRSASILLFTSAWFSIGCGGSGEPAEGTPSAPAQTNAAAEAEVGVLVKAHEIRKEAETAIKNCDTNALESIIKENPEVVNSRNKARMPLIHYACLTDCIDVVKVLVAHDVDMDQTDMTHRYPMHCAAASSTLEMVKYLESIGQDIHKVTERGVSVMSYAEGNFYQSGYEQRKLITRYLKQQGVKN